MFYTLHGGPLSVSSAESSRSAVLLIDCPSRIGLVANVSGLLYRHGANIAHADQHHDHEAGPFFMRIEWPLEGFDLSGFRSEFEALVAEMNMHWRLASMAERPRVAIFVSQHLLLYRHRSGELCCSIPLIIGNHPEAAGLARFYGVEFRHTPVMPESKAVAEQEQLRLLENCYANKTVVFD